VLNKDKQKFVIIVSPGNSGGGAVHDYLYSRDDFESPFLGEEFRLICDPYGLEQLYKNLYSNFSINNSAEAINEFKKYCFNLQKLKSEKTENREFIYGKNFYKISLDFINNIKFLEYIGLPQFRKISLKKHEDFNFIFKKKFFKIKNYDHELYKMYLPVNEKKFLELAKKYLINIFKSNLKNFKRKNIVLDQATSFWCPEIAFQYLNNLNIIIVTRDPRSVFYSMKSRGSFAYPGYDINIFINWYRSIMQKRKKIKNKFKKNILELKFENFVNNFEYEINKVNSFLKIKNEKKIKFDLNFSKNNVFKAKFNLDKSELKLIEKKLKEYLIW